MMRPPNILYILLTALTTAGALSITMKKPLLSALRDDDVTIPCDIYNVNTGRAISIIWKRKENGTDQNVYEYIDGRATLHREGCYMEEKEIPRGNAALHIPRVQFSDETEYTCAVINTPDFAEGRASLQVSVPPSADVTPANPSIELGTEKTVTCEVYSFYPKDISIRWVQYRKGSSDCEFLDIWTCAKNLLENSDGTYNVSSLLTLDPRKEDNGNTYTCLIRHRSLQTDLSRNLTLTVTEKEESTGAIIIAVIMTLLSVGFLGGMVFFYFIFIKKDPPTLSEITGNDELIDMNRTTLTCQIMDFRPNNIEISVCIRRSGEEEMTICTWRSGDLLNPARTSKDDGGGYEVVVYVDEEISLMNGSAGHMDRPLQLEIAPRIIKKKLGKSSCQCSLHITPSYDLDNGAELSVHVKHPALTSPTSKSRILNVIGVSPKLLSIMSPERIFHDEQLTLTCPINGFKPQALSITWLKRDKNHQEAELVTWNSGNHLTHSERYSHSLKKDDHEDKSHSIISALTMKPTVTEDDGVMYICRTFHSATNHRAERELTMRVTAAPVLENIVKAQEIVYVGEKVDLSCRIHSFYPPIIQVTWYTEDGVILPSHTTDPLPERDELHHVTSASSYTPTVKDLGKKFKCEVQHDSLSKPKPIIWKLEDFVSLPTLCDILCDPAQLHPGNPVTFSCVIGEMYPGEIGIQWQWSTRNVPDDSWKENINKDSSGMFSGTTELTLTPNNSDHFSEISLEVNHRGKRLTKKRVIMLEGLLMLSEISSDPRIPDYGRPVTLRCDVTGCNPGDTPRITWSERGQQRETRGSGDVLSCYLTITPTARDYGKVYTCSVTGKGMLPVTKECCLCLPEKPPTLSDIIVRPTIVATNQKASLQVQISGYCPKDLQIKWFKGFSTFPQPDVTMSERQIGLDSLYTCSSTLTFTPSMIDNKQTIRCEVTHMQTKAIRQKQYTLDLGGSSGKAETGPKTGPEKKTFHIREITCVTERPQVGEDVTLVAYIEACQADAAEFTWNNGMFPVDGQIENNQDGTDCTSTITFIPEESDTDCTIKLEVFYNYQTVEDSYTLQLV